MSADNFISISKSTFEVRNCCASCPEKEGNLIGKGKTLEEAIEIYEKWEKDDMFGAEYGVSFVE